MANYHLTSKIIGRAKGKSIVAAAAYRSCSMIHDNSIDQSFDYSNKRDLAFSEIILPQGSPAWASDRETLWNEVERIEKRKDAQLAREVEVSLPIELNMEQQTNLIREFVNENFVSNGMIADINIHDKEGNPHAHILLSLRDITPEGFGNKNRSWNNKSLIFEWRKSWADLQNAHLQKAGFDINVDHRSYVDREIDLEPQIHLGPIHNIEQKVKRSTKSINNNQYDRLSEYQRISLENGERIIQDPTIAINHLASHSAVFSSYDILKCANLYSYGQDQFYQVCSAIESHPDLVLLGTDDTGIKRYTSRDMLEKEQQMFESVDRLNSRSHHKVETKFQAQASRQLTMTNEQKTAFENIMSGTDISSLIGVAGTGKSYVLGAVKDAYEAQGYDVKGCALSGIASDGLQQSSGIESKTLTKILWEWSHGINHLTKRSVLVIDEAGMIGTRQMQRVIDHVEKTGSKLILVGDNEQTQAMTAGGSFRGIIDKIFSAKIQTVIRQQVEWQKMATQEFSSSNRDDVIKAITRYNVNGNIHFQSTLNGAKEKLVSDWSDSIGQFKNDSHLILAFQKADVNDLNILARGKMKSNDLLGKVDHGFLKSDLATIDLSINDRVMFLKNNRSLNVKNGSIGTITGIKNFIINVKLDNDVNVAFDIKKYRDIDYGYAATINKTQGVTVDRAFTLATTQFDKHLTYVSMSRHRKTVNLYAGGGLGSNEKYCFESFGHFKDTVSKARYKNLIEDFAFLRGLEPHENRIFDLKDILKKETDQFTENDLSAILKYLTKNNSVFTEDDVQAISKKYKYDFESLFNTINSHPEVLKVGENSKGLIVYTTIDNFNSEMNIFRHTEELNNIVTFKVDTDIREKIISEKSMSDEQLKAFNNILDGSNLSSMIGYAGTGKSYTLGSLNEAYTAQGYNVMGCAISGIAAEGLQADTKIKSATLYKIIRDLNYGKITLTDKDVIVVDEAGLIGTVQMEQLIKVAVNSGSKVILTGDYQQLQSISAGGIFKGIIDRHGHETLSSIRRQTIEWQKEATIKFSGSPSDVTSAIMTYMDEGNVYFDKSFQDTKNRLVEDWKQSLIENPTDKNHMFAFRRKDVEELNDLARNFMKDMGYVGGNEYNFATKQNINVESKVHLDDDILSSQSTKKRSFAPGDRLMFMRNDNDLGVKNGSLATVLDLNENEIKVKLDSNEETITFSPKIYNEFGYGYASTIHKTQGVTVDKSFVLATPHFDKHMTYVSMSRHKQDVSLYASVREGKGTKECFKNREEFFEKLSNEKLKDLAMDYASGTKEETKKAQTEMIRPVERQIREIPDVKKTAQEIIREAKEIHRHVQNEGKGSFVDAMRDIQNGMSIGQRTDELERFKKEINLSEYAAYKGYMYDKKESYTNVITMRNDYEKINVSKGNDGHWVFHSWTSGKGGSIIDFVQEHEGKNLGEVRKALRPWIGEPEKRPQVSETLYQRTVQPVKKDRESVLNEFKDIIEASDHKYLRTRGIEKIDPRRFQGKVFIDSHRNAVFPHIDREGVCCLEKRNTNFKGMSIGGDKGLWCSHTFTTDNKLVITEAPIDALSYQELRYDENARYISFGGRMNEKQKELLKAAINRMPDNSVIVLATDKGIDGDKFAAEITAMSENKNHRIVRATPEIGKDWNEQLQHIKGIKNYIQVDKDNGMGMNM